MDEIQKRLERIEKKVDELIQNEDVQIRHRELNASKENIKDIRNEQINELLIFLGIIIGIAGNLFVDGLGRIWDSILAKGAWDLFSIFEVVFGVVFVVYFRYAIMGSYKIGEKEIQDLRKFAVDHHVPGLVDARSKLEKIQKEKKMLE